jgi:hypothetical protein
VRHEVMSGILPVGSILARGVHQMMEFTCITHTQRDGWMCRRVRVCGVVCS